MDYNQPYIHRANGTCQFDALLGFLAGFFLITLSICLLIASFSIASLFLFQIKSGVFVSIEFSFMHAVNKPKIY